ALLPCDILRASQLPDRARAAAFHPHRKVDAMHLLINIDVDDLARAEAFYRDAFGLSAARRFGDGAVEMLGAQAPIHLLRKPAGSNAAGDARRDYHRHWTHSTWMSWSRTWTRPWPAPSLPAPAPRARCARLPGAAS